jgi:CHAT domain-containing protein
MNPIREPFSMAKRERTRRRLMAVVTLSAILWGYILYASVRAGMRPSGLAEPVAVYVSLSAAVEWCFFCYTMLARYRARVGWHLASGCLFGTGSGVMILGFAVASWHLSAPAAAVLALGATVAGAIYAVRMTRYGSRQSLAWLARRPITHQAAQETYEASQRVMNARRMSAEEGKTIRLTRARAAITRSISDDAPDGLVEAADELRELLADPPESWLMTIGVAADLVDASYFKADKHGDLADYEAALQLLADTADRMPPDLGATAVVWQKRAAYHMVLAGRLPLGPEANAQLAEAATSWRAAIAAVSPPLRGLLPVLHADLGAALAYAHDPAAFEAGIAECRTAIRLAGRSPRARGYPQRSLAMLLTDRAMEVAANTPDDVPESVLRGLAAAMRADLAEAGRLLRRARRFGGADERGQSMRLLPEIHMARSVIFGSRNAERRAIGAWRSAAIATAHDDPLLRAQVGKSWVDWAQESNNASWCAEAYAYLMSAVPPAVAVRYLAGERDRVLADIQSTAEEAGYWLAQVGQIGEAVIAMEQGRAVSLSEVLGRERHDLEVALHRAARTDLLESYRVAVYEYRAATVPGSDESHSSSVQRAWARYQTVVREIAAVAGIDLPGVPPTFAELSAAAREGPVVYLAAASRGGYAVIVRSAGPPVYHSLPLLTRTEVADRLARFTQAADIADIAAMAHWLWIAGIGRLTRDLPAGALITIVPVGLLSLLPVHAAGGPTAPDQSPEDWAFLADKVTVRYAPNARTLLRSSAQASELPTETLSLLAVAAPYADPGRPLRHTTWEVTQISRLWSKPARADTITDGAHAAVMLMLADYSVWHIACHCDAQPERILDSALLLTGARLSLRDILALPPSPRRLAVLSACQTHLSDSRLPDEAMGLPAGLLQAGFVGVIASHWPVVDRSTALLMIRFHDLWHSQGLPPAAALAEAQRWLRTATYADLYAYCRGRQPGMHPSERSNEQRPFRHPYYWAPFALTGH